MKTLDNTTVIGLTGQSGAGKTTLVSEFIDSGYVIIDADKIAREVVKPGSKCLAEIEMIFPDCIDGNKSLDRGKIAEVIFTDANAKKIYTKIVFQYIVTEVLAEIRAHKSNGNKYILLDAPTLFESGCNDFCRKVIAVIAPYQVRLQRIIERDNLTSYQAENRMKAQKDDDFFKDRCDYVIENNGSVQKFLYEARVISKKIMEDFNDI